MPTKSKVCGDCGLAPTTKVWCKPCGYKNRVQPKRGEYELKVANRAWYPKGNVPVNKGVLRDRIGYKELHRWVRRELGSPTTCEFCGRGGLVEWANKSHEYKRSLADWIALCRFCHKKYDSGEHRGKAIKIFGKKGVNQ